MDRDFYGKKFNAKENINNKKVITSKFFVPAPPTPSLILPPKKPALDKSLPKSRQMYRRRIISSDEVSRKKIKLDKEKAMVASRADVEADNAEENDDEFFEKIRQKYEKDKSLGLFVGGSQKKNVKKVKKLFSDECVKLIDKFKEACKNSAPTELNASKILDFDFTEQFTLNKASNDNFLTQNIYPSTSILNNSNYQNSLKIPESENFLLQTPSSFSGSQKLTPYLGRDDSILSFMRDPETLSLHNQFSSPTNLKSPMSILRTPSSLSQFPSQQFPVDNADNELTYPRCSYTPSLPSRSNSYIVNNRNNFNQDPVRSEFHLSNYMFKK